MSQNHITSFGVVKEQQLDNKIREERENQEGLLKGRSARRQFGGTEDGTVWQMVEKMRFGFEYEILICAKEPDIDTENDLDYYAQNRLSDKGIDTKFKEFKKWVIEQFKGDLNNWSLTEDSSVIEGETLYENDPSENILVNEKDLLLNAGFEFVSPIIESYSNIEKSFNDFDERLKAAKTLRFYNSETTSNHVHVSHANFKQLRFVVKIFMAWLYFEPIFALMVHAHRRNNVYCHLLGRYFHWRQYRLNLTDGLAPWYTINDVVFEDIFKNMHEGNLFEPRFIGEPFQTKDMNRFINVLMPSRYLALNMRNLHSTGIGTIEVRLKHGSNDMKENAKWVQLLALFFAAAMKQKCVTELYDEEDRNMFWSVTKYTTATAQPVVALLNIFEKLKEFIGQGDKTLTAQVEDWRKVLFKMTPVLDSNKGVILKRTFLVLDSNNNNHIGGARPPTHLKGRYVFVNGRKRALYVRVPGNKYYIKT